MEGEVLNTQVVVHCPLSRPPNPPPLLDPSCLQSIQLVCCYEFPTEKLCEAVRPKRPLSWWVAIWSLAESEMESVMFHLPTTASLSLSLHQKPPMFYSGPGLGEGKGTGWVASTTCHHGFSINFSGLEWLSRTEIYLPSKPINIKHIS